MKMRLEAIDPQHPQTVALPKRLTRLNLTAFCGAY
jgi:hypothetical protein